MALEAGLGAPLEQALNSVVQPKLVSLGWSSEDDTSLAEYIVLMLQNGKTQDQIASELSSDLLPDESGTLEFSKWLFDQISLLRNKESQPDNNESTASVPQQQAASLTEDVSKLQTPDPDFGGTDAEMGDATGAPVDGIV
ncbi:MAG: hypothetical protein Q9160_002122 [Pyrenula sp. 1 TL-2023]